MSRLPLVVGAVALAGVLLTACGAPIGPGGSADPDPSPTRTAEHEGDDSGLVQQEIPRTFPSEVPLIDGDVVFAVDLGTGWTVIFASGDPLADFDTALGQLTDAGFEVAAQDANADAAFAQLTTARYTINLSAGNDPTYGDVVSYTVVLN